jgi:hypothetical protein
MFALVGVVVVWERLELPGSIMWRARRSQEREAARLLRASTDVLLSEARSAITYEHWERFAPARALLQGDRWTDAELLRVLDELFAAVGEDDNVNGRSGRASNYFEFYDCGLASIVEALRKRTAPAPAPVS